MNQFIKYLRPSELKHQTILLRLPYYEHIGITMLSYHFNFDRKPEKISNWQMEDYF